MPRQIYCWQCCGLVCLLHVVVWNPPLISKDSVTVIEDDWTGTPHKMPVGLSVHEFYTPQLLRPESSFFLYTQDGIGGKPQKLHPDKLRKKLHPSRASEQVYFNNTACLYL